MNTLRFGLFAGALWALLSLVLIAASAIIGYRLAWVELDFRILSGTILLATKALGLGDAVIGLAFYAETGLPITPVHIISCAALSFADGFTSGVLIALIYNALTGGGNASTPRKAASFGIATGIALGISSCTLALTCMAYGVGIITFDFTARPVWAAFYLASKAGMNDFLPALRDSYIYFPLESAGALAWAAWGFIDGLVGGSVLAYLYLKAREAVKA